MAKRRALCVAIDDYGHPANNLNSCIADSQAFEQLLRSTYGFDEVHALQNEEATIKNVEEGIAWLVEDAQPDDRLVFHFSGHGYQRPNNDVLEEVLVLRDGFFQDDRLSELSQRLPGRNLTVVLDSCFSGGMEKILILTDEGIEVGRPKRWTPIDAQQLQKEYAELDKAVTVKLKPFGAAQPVEDPVVLSKEFGFASPIGADKAALAPAPPSDERGQLQMKGLLLSACVENETASAKTSKTNGLSAFTFGITEALKEVGPKATTSDLMATVQRHLKAMGFRQTPLMKAPPDATDLGEQSFLLFEAGNRPKREGFSEPDIERIMELVRNTLKEGIPMATTATQMPETQMPDEKLWGIAIPIALNLARRFLTKEYQPGMGGMGAQPSVGSAAELDEKGWRDVFTRALPIAMTIGRELLTKEYQAVR
jgi:hypothetical protein